MDSHADTVCLGSGARLVCDTGDSVSVEGYKPNNCSDDRVPIVCGAIAYDCPTTQQTYVLFFPQALWIPEMPQHLLSTFQLRDNNVIINDIPLQHLPKSKWDDTAHTIQAGDPPVTIPLSLRGVSSGFLSRQPTIDEINAPEDSDIIKIEMTSEAEWNPAATVHATIEQSLDRSINRGSRYIRALSSQPLRGQGSTTRHQLRGQDSTMDQVLQVLPSIAPEEPPLDPLEEPDFSLPYDVFKPFKSSTEDDEASVATAITEATTVLPDDDSSVDDTRGINAIHILASTEGTRCINAIHSLGWENRSIAAVDVDRYASLLEPKPVVQVKSMSTKVKRKGFVQAEQLAKNWHISLELAKATVDATTQLAVRDFTNVTGTKRLKPHAYMLRYPRLETKMYSDTLFARKKSLRGNTCGQLFCTEDHAVRFYPMGSKKQAHYSLDVVFKEWGIPQVMITDNAKELTEGKWRHKCKKVQCTMASTEPYTPNQNMAEAEIREVKRQHRKVMHATGMPIEMWDYAMEWV